MTWTNLRCAATAVLLPLLVAAGLAGCGALDVSDPTAIEDKKLDNASGADLLRRDALKQFYVAVGSGALASGLLADEFFSDPPSYLAASGQVSDEEMLDRRESRRYEDLLAAQFNGGVYGSWQDARRATAVALARLRAYTPEPPQRAYIGEMLAVRGFVTLRLAEDFCPGFPLNDVVDLRPVYGPPLSTDDALTRALADFDSALVYAADSARVLHLAQVGRARALLGLGRFGDAAAAVSPVPVDYVWTAEYSSNASQVKQPNALAFGQDGDRSRSVADQEGGTGLNFVAANDPRVKTTLLGTANDGVTPIYGIAKYPDPGAPIVLASGVEARLIEAEADLKAGGTAWLAVLNDLRRNQVTPALADTTDPGSPDARVDLLFRERAFWLFGTGHRLADMRRLVARYGRSSESIFPTGAYRLGDSYSMATSIPFPAALDATDNPAITGCTSR